MGFLGFGKEIKDAGAGVKDAFTGAGDGISSIINAAKGQVPPEIMLQLQELETDIKLKGMELSLQTQESLYNAMIQYEGSATQVPKWILVLRSIIRPLLTLVFSFSFCFFMAADIINKGTEEYQPSLENLPEQYWWMLGIVLTFWFGGKIGENIADKLNQ